MIGWMTATVPLPSATSTRPWRPSARSLPNIPTRSTAGKLDRYEEAITAGLRAAEIDPNNQFAWSSLSLAYNANKQKELAEAAGAKARIISWGGKIRVDPAPGQKEEPAK